MISQDSLTKDLMAMGLLPGDTVLVHSSMKAIGPVDGGAETVLNALMAYFSPGLLCFPTLSWQTLELQPPAFDVQHTPSIVGILPELFRQRPGVLRSHNPTHSISAMGRDAADFLKDDLQSGTPCGPSSSWYKLVQRDASILMVGCDLTSCTFLHGVEEWCQIPGRLAAPTQFILTLPGGGQQQVSSCGHASQPSPNYWKVEEGLIKAGILRFLPFGRAKTYVMKAGALYRHVAGVLKEHPGIFDQLA